MGSVDCRQDGHLPEIGKGRVWQLKGCTDPKTITPRMKAYGVLSVASMASFIAIMQMRTCGSVFTAITKST